MDDFYVFVVGAEVYAVHAALDTTRLAVSTALSKGHLFLSARRDCLPKGGVCMGRSCAWVSLVSEQTEAAPLCRAVSTWKAELLKLSSRQGVGFCFLFPPKT